MMVDIYTDLAEELHAVRNDAALLDMSPLSKYLVTGTDAGRFVNHIITRDATQIEPDQVVFTPWCDERGHVNAEGLITRIGDTYRFSSNPMAEWFARWSEPFEVEIHDVSDHLGIVSLQGPRAFDVLERATAESWQGFPFSRRRVTRIAGAEVDVIRQGFTGEQGFELWVQAQDAGRVWDALLDSGQPGIRPAGLHAIDLARLEGGMIIGGPDYTPATVDSLGSKSDPFLSEEYKSTPGEVGMGRFVDLEKPSFVGRDALVAEAETGGPKRRLVGLELDWRDMVRSFLDRDIPPHLPPRAVWDPQPVFVGDQKVGRATSVAWSPTLSRLIGFGCINRELVDAGTQVTVGWPIGDAVVAVDTVVSELPFIAMRRS